MTIGKLYGIGVGPGDPELLTIKAANLLRQARHVFAPLSAAGADSVALTIAQQLWAQSHPKTETPRTRSELIAWCGCRGVKRSGRGLIGGRLPCCPVKSQAWMGARTMPNGPDP